MRGTPVFALLALSGCGNLLGISDLTGPTNGPGPGVDAGFDGDAATFAPYDVTGTVSLIDPAGGKVSPFPSTVDLLTAGNQLYATVSATGANAAFTVHVTDALPGASLHVRRDAGKQTVDAYTLFAGLLSSATNAGVVTTITSAGLIALEESYFNTSSIDGSVVIVILNDVDGRPVSGVSLTSTDLDSTVRYLATAGSVDPELTQTSSTGEVAIYHPKATTAAYIATGSVTASTGALSISQTSLNTLILQSRF